MSYSSVYVCNVKKRKKKLIQTITNYSVTDIFKVSNKPCLALTHMDHIMVRCRNPLTFTVHVIIPRESYKLYKNTQIDLTDFSKLKTHSLHVNI